MGESDDACFSIHYNGNLVQRGDNLAYTGGKTRLLMLPYTSGFDELKSKILARIDTKPNETIEVKCPIPAEGSQKLIVIDIEDDEDLQAVLNMFKHYTITLGTLYVTKSKPIKSSQPISKSAQRVPRQVSRPREEEGTSSAGQSNNSVDGRDGEVKIPIRESNEDGASEPVRESKEDGASSEARKLMRKVPHTVRESEFYSERHYKPRAVSIGPYHSGDNSLRQVNLLKPKIARVFHKKQNDSDLDQLVENFKGKIDVKDYQNLYVDDQVKQTGEEAFTRMLFMDGCFILGFIKCIVTRQVKELGIRNDQIELVQKDLFLLENQLPYKVLGELIELVDDDISVEWDCMLGIFISGNFNFKFSWADISFEMNAFHLLDLQLMTLGKPRKRSSFPTAYDKNTPFFRGVKELTEAGVKLMPKKPGYLRDLSFHSSRICGICGRLTLPYMTIDKSTRQKFLNLIAYETSLLQSNEFEFISYMRFLDLLIDDASDVKELRTAGILDNRLPNDEEVAKLFNDIGIDLGPDNGACKAIKMQIDRHFSDRKKHWMVVWLVEGLGGHFKNSWSTFALFGTFIAVSLTAIQTYLSV